MDIPLSTQILYLFFLAIPIACIAWTVTHEEVFREPREYCVKRSQNCERLVQRKFFYLFTCEYCFSHYVTIFMLIITGFKMIFTIWGGVFILGFSLCGIAKLFLGLFGFLGVDSKKVKFRGILKKGNKKKPAKRV